MKKLSLILFVVCGISSLASAQVGISKGIMGGLNLSKEGGSDAAPGVSSVAGYAAGIFVEIDLPGPFSIEPEALYSRKGSKIDSPALGGTLFDYGVTSITNKYTYVDIPVLLKYHFPLPVVHPVVFAGPSMGILLSAKETLEAPLGLPPSFSGDIDVKENLRKNDIGAVVGVGVELAVIGLRGDLRYSYGIATIDKDGSLKVYNRVISVYVGLAL